MVQNRDGTKFEAEEKARPVSEKGGLKKNLKKESRDKRRKGCPNQSVTGKKGLRGEKEGSIVVGKESAGARLRQTK